MRQPPLSRAACFSAMSACAIDHSSRAKFWCALIGSVSPPVCTEEQYVEYATAAGSAEAAGGWRDDSFLASGESALLPVRYGMRIHRVYLTGRWSCELRHVYGCISHDMGRGPVTA